MKTLLMLAVLGVCVVLVCGGCTYQLREPAVADPYYTRGEVDAINAENQCRTMARNLVQAQRCGVRR